MSWQPNGKLDFLHQRAQLLDRIRAFFKARGVLEVETPLLCRHTVTDPFIDSFQVDNRYLQTSPEYAMKRLLAAGSGPIYQITKAFRREESGRHHNCEFTLLEWYRPGFTHLDLITEIDALLQTTLNTLPAHTVTYQSLFETHFNINPHTTDASTLRLLAQQHLTLTDINQFNVTSLLQMLMAHCIEPHLGIDRPTFIIDYPAEQAALATIKESTPPVAERFELIVNGMELANGFNELNDPTLQRHRFEQDQAYRRTLEKNIPTIDSNFINSLNTLPDCAGVALGIDRLTMLYCNTNTIDDVISFNFDRA